MQIRPAIHVKFLFGIYSMICKGYNVELLITKAKELHSEAKPRIIHDNKKQYVAKEFKNLLTLFGIADSKTMPFHPQSNGKVLRFHRTLKTEHVHRTPYVSVSL